MSEEKKAKKESIFGKEALEKQNKRESLNDLMVVLSPKIWIALWTILSIIALVLIWTFLGIIPQEENGQGILLNSEANYVIQSVQEGHMNKILVNQGDKIKKGQLLGMMYSDKLDVEMSNAEKEKEMAISQLMDFKLYEHKKIKAEKKALIESSEAARKDIGRIESELEFLRKEYGWKEELHDKGILALPSLNKTREQIDSQLNAAAQSKNLILKNEAKWKSLEDITQYQEYYTRLRKIENRIQEYDLAKEQLKIRASHDGSIIAIPVQSEELITRGKVVFWCEKATKEPPKKVIYGFFLKPKDQRIRAGMIAQVRLGTVDYRRHGEMLARVRKVWEFPSSAEEVYDLLGNKQIVKYLTKGEAPIQVLLEPIVNKNTVSGYSWTSKKGPPYQVDTGTMSTIKVVVKAKKPYEYIFPIYRTIRDSFVFSRIENKKVNRCEELIDDEK